MLLSVHDLHKSYPTQEGPLPVLRGVSLQLEAGESVALTGESGSGKSTLLHLVAGLDAPDSGSIELAGSRVDQLDDRGRAALRRRDVGLVFQQFNLVPSLNVADNLRLSARLAGREDPELAAHLAERLGLTDFLTRYPEQLSGGQQQRLAIGRTLAARPKLVLADEPTGNLDEATASAVIVLLVDLVAQSDAGLLTVTHSQHLASAMQRRIHLQAGRIA